MRIVGWLMYLAIFLIPIRDVITDIKETARWDGTKWSEVKWVEYLWAAFVCIGVFGYYLLAGWLIWRN